MKNFFPFLPKKQKVVLVLGRGRELATQAIFDVLKGSAKIIKKTVGELGFLDMLGAGIFLISCDEKNISQAEKNRLSILLSHSCFSLVILTHLGEPHPDSIIFAGEKVEGDALLAFLKSLPPFEKCIYNVDDELLVELKGRLGIVCESFGFGEDAGFRASDIMITETHALCTNFKVNHGGKIVPVWLMGLFGKEHVYAVLAATATGLAFGRNLVEVSQALTYYQGLPGRMRLLPGIKNTMILDDTTSSSILSMAEGIEILGKIKAKRKVAVLGDVVGAGKYTIEAHESLGERVVKSGIELLFTIGSRAKFIAEAAKNRGLAENHIHSFDAAEEAIPLLRTRIEEGDVVLVDGSAEMKMSKIVEALSK